MKNNKIKIILFSFLFLSFFIPINVEATIDGDLYICDFQQYAVGTQQISEYALGDLWLNISTHGVSADRYQVTKTHYDGSDLGTKAYGFSKSTTASSGDQYCWWNFTGGYKNISFDLHEHWAQAHVYSMYFYSGDHQVGRLIINDQVGTGADNIKLYANDEGVVTYDHETNYLSFSIIIRNNDSICLTIYNETGDYLNAWDTGLGGYDVITRVYIYQPIAVIGAIETWWDNITVNTEDMVEYAWDVDYDSYGNVYDSYYGQTSVQVTSTNPYAGDEIRKDDVGLTQSGLTIRQIALALDNNTDYSDLTINAMINGHNFGEYDTLYNIQIDGITRYIIVWQNLNQFFYAENVLVEFEAIRESGTPTFSVLTVNYDVDEDDDKESYYWGAYNSPDYFDGLYDGSGLIYSANEDLLYQVWFNTTGSGGEYGIEGFEDYDVIGDLFGYEGTVSFPVSTLEGTYNVENTHKVKAIDLLISNAMYNNIISGSYGYSNFRCNVNGETDEEVNAIFPFGNDIYVMRWIFDTSIQIENDTINVAFYTNSGLRWYIKVSTDDNNGDNLIEFKTHSSIVAFKNGEYDGTSYAGYDLVYAVYYEQEFITPKDYNDFIGTDKLNYEQYETVIIQGTIEDEAMPYSIHAYYDDGGWIEFDEYGYPIKKINANTFMFYLTPIYSGEWKINLVKDVTIVSTCWFNVTGKDVDYVIITTPNPSMVGQGVNIYALYNFSDNYDVRISIETDWRTYYYDVPIKQALSYIGSITFVKEGIYSFFMQRRYNDSYKYWSDIIQYVHVTRSKDYDCFITISDRVLELNDIQKITYQHNQLGNINVRLVINDKLSGIPIYAESFGVIEYKCNQIGDYKVGMVLLDTDGSYNWIVENVTWSCIGNEGYDEAPLLPEVGVVVGAILGTIVVSVFAMLPMIMAFSFHKEPRNVPPLVYAFTTAIGLILSISFGFFGVWVAFVFVAVGIIISLIVYLQGRQST